MTQSHRVSAVLIGCAGFGLLALSGCSPAKQQFRTSFLPPAPRASEASEPAPVLPVPPAAPNAFPKEVPNLFAIQTPVARGSEIDNRLHRAEERFEAGKRAYQAGRQQEARRLFDQAVDILLGAPEGAPDRPKLERHLDQMVDNIYRYDVNGLGAGEDADKVTYDKSPLDGLLEMTFPIDPRLKPKVNEELQGTVSQLPLEQSDSVLSYIHFFSTEKGKRILTAGLRRAGRYRPLITRVLGEEGVPQELIYLAQAESGFLPRAVSYKSAAGMWQFLNWRAQEYGLQITKDNDERLDPEKATRAAARHLRDLYNQFGDWYLAMAAYNCGPGCVDRAVQRTGYADFFTLRSLDVLPQQTQNYVPAILAITIMAKNPKDYGLEDIDPDAPIDYDTVKMDAPTSVALVADALERPIAEVRDLNPSLLKSVAPKGYELRIPKGSVHPLMAALDNVPADRRDTWRMHHVERGETLADIARRYKTAASAIASVNNSTIAAPEAGDVLLIPASYSAQSVKESHSKIRSGVSSRKRVSQQVLHRRATARRLKSASLGKSR